MRVTLHLVTARDFWRLRAVLQPVLDRFVYGRDPVGSAIEGVDVKTLLAAGRELLAERPLSRAELVRLLEQRWPDRDGWLLSRAVANLVPLVQPAPRGMWGSTARPALTTAESWIGPRPRKDASVDEMILRYLAAFGPATVADVQMWSRLTKLREVVERLRPRLRTFRDERGRELFDVPDAPLSDPETPAPPRFLPDFDNALIGHADRNRIYADEDRRRIGIGRPTVLVDGFVRATWKLTRRRGTATLHIEPFESLSKEHMAAVTDEGCRLLAFVAGDVAAHDVRLAAPP
jgi:hypothetical protein